MFGFVDDTGAVKDTGVTVFSVGEEVSEGTDGSDLIIAYKTKTVQGGDGNDWLVGYQSTLLDGGAGDDAIIALNNIFDDNDPAAITAGGLGRDLIINFTRGGLIWGDIQDSLLDTTTDQRYVYDPVTKARVDIADSSENADNVWWTPNTTIKDPQFHDKILFFGIPLVGGDTDGGAVLGTTVFGKAGAIIGAVQTFRRPVDTIYTDEFLPFIIYKFDRQSDGSYDLIIGNVLTSFLDATEALIGGPASGLSAALKKYIGVQRIKDYLPIKDDGALPVTYSGALARLLADQNQTGKLGLVFKKYNPIYTIIARLRETAISFALGGGGPMVDKALTLSAAVMRYSKALSWSTGGDPLVLGLSGHGIKTTALDASAVHFDLNSNFFAERTGWRAGPGSWSMTATITASSTTPARCSAPSPAQGLLTSRATT